MRHTKISTTMEVYAQAGMEKKRVARWKAVDALFDRKQRHRLGQFSSQPLLPDAILRCVPRASTTG